MSENPGFLPGFFRIFFHPFARFTSRDYEKPTFLKFGQKVYVHTQRRDLYINRKIFNSYINGRVAEWLSHWSATVKVVTREFEPQLR